MIPKLHSHLESWPLLDGFSLDVKVSYDTRWIFHRIPGSSIRVFRSPWVRFGFLACSKLISLNSVPFVILLISPLKKSATPHIFTTRIGSRAEISAGSPWGGVDWISNRRWGTQFNLLSRYHSRSSPTMPGKSLCANITYSSRIFPHTMDCGNPIMTFSVTTLQSIAASTEVIVFPEPISSATSAPGISSSQTHLLTMNQMALTWCANNSVPGRPGIEYLQPGTPSSVDWRWGCAFSTITASSRHSCLNSLLIVLRIVFCTELVFSGSRTSSPFSTWSWTSLALVSVFFASSMTSFSFSDVSWADKLIFRCSRNSSQCLVSDREVTIWTNTCGRNIINSILSIRSYINSSIILVPTILLSLLFSLSSTLLRTFQSLCIMISSCSRLALTWVARSTFVGLITCSATSFPVALIISTTNIFTLCPSFNLKAFERQQLYKMWPYMGSSIICPSLNIPIYASSNSSCSKLHLNIDVRMYGSFRPLFLLMKSTNSSQRLTSGYEACSCLGTRTKSLPFNTQWMITMNVIFGNSGRLLFALLPTHSPKSVAGRLLHGLPFILTSQILLAHFFKNITTHCQRVHSVLSKFTNSSHILNVAKTSATAVSQSRGPSQTCFKPLRPWIIDRCFLCWNRTTHSLFHMLNPL